MMILTFLVGLAVLSLGAELFVRGASRLASLLGVSPLIIGLTVVAFGTSAPEVAVVVRAGFQGQGDMGIGNVVGSNIANFLLILGIAALITPLAVSYRLIRMEVPLLLGVSVLVILLGYDGRLNTLEGFLLLGGAVVYTAFVILNCRKEILNNSKNNQKDEMVDETTPPTSRKSWLKNRWLINGIYLSVGLVGLVQGASWLVSGASDIARSLGISELLIGLTMVAVGTSLPELATVVSAGIRGERDMVIGNIVGSNLFNLMFVLGVAVIVLPQGLPVPGSTLAFDLPVMLAVTAAGLPIFLTGLQISRWEGLLFLSYYGAYILYLFLYSTEHDLLPAYSGIMLRFIIPLTVLLILMVMAKAILIKRKTKSAGE
jgi:cation:H+ antiporter